MLAKTINYEDYDGNEISEVFYFNLTKTELALMQLKTPGGLQNRLQKIVDTKDTVGIITFFEELIGRAYGERSDDGKRFIKSKEISEKFKQTLAYDNLFMELIENPERATAFIKGIVPATPEANGAIPADIR